MPRKNPLPERERQICQRLRQFRHETKLSRVAFGQALNLDTTTLSNLEHARMRVRFVVAKRMGERFALNLRYLGEGIEPKFGYDPLHEKLGIESFLFSEVYEKHKAELARRAELRNHYSQSGVYVSFQNPIGSPPEEALARSISDDLARELKSIPPGLRPALIASVLQAARRFSLTHTGKGEEIELTLVTEFSNTEEVNSELDKLIKRTKRLTLSPGKRAQLARYLGVKLPRVSEWLAGKHEPGGEVTLQLLHWVTAEEVKQKSPGSATNTARAKTR